MEKITYDIQFTVPAFLGDAEQQSAWRTPPFKALIQHWWRVAVAQEHGYDWCKIRESEGKLFGHAWLDNGSWAMRSRVRIKLDQQKAGELLSWQQSPSNQRITHPEVKDRNTGKLRPMAPETYLAYGPLHFRDGLAHTPAIKANEKNQLTLVYPKQDQATFLQVMQLVHWFGALGGRSRNAWGSVGLQSDKILKNFDLQSIKTISRPLADCLQLDWPHAIGADEHGLLIWQTPEQENWQLVIKDLAITKINFRTALPFPNARPGGFENRHLLAYPVTNHSINSWVNTGRLANQIRFKVAKTANNKFVGIIVHLPCGLPKEMTQTLRNPPPINQQIEIWQKIHHSLKKQAEPQLTRISQ